MSSLRIPASYIATGNNPGEIPVRDGKGNIAGVPVIYNSILADETAKLMREIYPTGFVRGGNLVGGNPTQGEFNKIFLDATNQHVEILVRGYRVNLAINERVPFVLTQGPAGGYRDDLVFLEVWFAGLTNGGKSIQHAWRIVEDINFTQYPEGIDDPKVKPLANFGTFSNTGFMKLNPVTDVALKDPGLYTAAVPAPSFDNSAETGLDGNPYYLVYAVPVARIKRLNVDTYNGASNPNGSNPGGWVSGGVSSRPDGLWHNVVDSTQIIDLRHMVQFVDRRQEEFERTIYDQLTNKLVSNGLARKINVSLGNGGLRGYFGDIAATKRINVSMNMLKNSHFRSVESSGVATQWERFVSPVSSNLSTTGVLSAADPDGQNIARPASNPEDKFGISTQLSGFKSQHFTFRLGYTPRPTTGTSPNAAVVVEFWPKDADVHNGAAPLFSLTSPYLYQQTETLQELVGHFNSPLFWEDLDVYVYTVGTSAQLTLNYLDIKADERLLPVIEVEAGDTFTIKSTAELIGVGAALSEDNGVVIEGVTGGQLGSSTTGQIVRSGLYDVRVQLNQVPVQSDIKVELDIEFPVGSGFSELYERPIKFEQSGYSFMGFITPLETTKNLSASELGAALEPNTVITVVNPGQGAYGVKARIRVVSNGGLSYTLPATVQGARVAAPITVKTLQGNVESSLPVSAVYKNTFATVLLTPGLAGQTTISVESNLGIRAGASIYVGTELKTVQTVVGSTVTLDSALLMSHDTGSVVTGDGRCSFTLSGPPVASGEFINVEVALEAPACVADPKANGVTKLLRTVVLGRPTVASSTLFVPVPGLALGRIASIACSSVFVNGTAEPVNGVTVTVVSGGLQLVFTEQKTGRIDVAALVEHELDESREVTGYYEASVPALVTGIPASAEFELIAAPKLFVHTKGTGGADNSGTFTELPFVRDSYLTGTSIALSGGQPVRPFLSDVPLVINKLGPLPLFAGRRFKLQDLFAEGFEVEGPPLSAATNHRTVLMAYVNYRGTHLLLVAQQNRPDARTRVSSEDPGASELEMSVALYQPNGRPIAVN